MSILHTRNNGASRAVNSVLIVCTAFLAAEPIVWLLRTWFDDSFGSYGEWAFVAVLALFAWSVSSPRRGASSPTLPAALFTATALVRVAGHVLAVNIIGGLALIIDAFALGLLFGLHQRARAVSPFWVAALFGLSLPLERIVQRLVGFGLQQVSAAGACGALSAGFEDVQCHGVEILLRGQHVLVDLPCSGTRGLLLTAAAFMVLAAITRPAPGRAAVGVAVALLSALIGNTVRITALAIGIAYPEVVGIDVMAQPWHDIIGLVTLGMGLGPIVVWARRVPQSKEHVSAPGAGSTAAARLPKSWIAVALAAACVVVAATPHHPIDVARPIGELRLPLWLAGHPAERVELSSRESDYFTKFGGAAAKATFGARTLLVVRTSAPIRHLHAPNECLTGAGYDVHRIGISHGAMPGATYRAIAPDGTTWRVLVSYRSDAGESATSISEVVWLWLKNPNTTWTAIERVHPWDATDADDEAFDHALNRVLEDSTLET